MFMTSSQSSRPLFGVSIFLCHVVLFDTVHLVVLVPFSEFLSFYSEMKFCEDYGCVGSRPLFGVSIFLCICKRSRNYISVLVPFSEFLSFYFN